MSRTGLRPTFFFFFVEKWRWWANEFLALHGSVTNYDFSQLKKIFLKHHVCCWPDSHDPVRLQSCAPALLFGGSSLMNPVKHCGHLLMTHGCCTQMVTRLKVMDAPIGHCQRVHSPPLELWPVKRWSIMRMAADLFCVSSQGLHCFVPCNSWKICF